MNNILNFFYYVNQNPTNLKKLCGQISKFEKSLPSPYTIKEKGDYTFND